MTEQEWLTTYRDTAHPLFGYIARRTGGNRALTEDVVQEAYMRALADWGRKAAPDSPLAWLKRTAMNVLIDGLRRSKAAMRDYFATPPEPADPAAQAAFESLDLVLALSSLRRRQARVVEAFYFDGMSVREIASEMAVSERAVEGLLRRARRSLKARLPIISSPGGSHV